MSTKQKTKIKFYLSLKKKNKKKIKIMFWLDFVVLYFLFENVKLCSCQGARVLFFTDDYAVFSNINDWAFWGDTGSIITEYYFHHFTSFVNNC